MRTIQVELSCTTGSLDPLALLTLFSVLGFSLSLSLNTKHTMQRWHNERDSGLPLKNQSDPASQESK